MYQRGTGDNCDKCHLSPGQEKSTSNKGDVIVAFKRHALNLIPIVANWWESERILPKLLCGFNHGYMSVISWSEYKNSAFVRLCAVCVCALHT